MSLTRHGTAADFPTTSDPVLPLSAGERAAYHEQLGTYWQDAGFTPDFPRAAQLWTAHWHQRFPRIPIRGVIALDPVALSYLLTGTGPVQVGSTELTSDNAVQELLNTPYLTLAPRAQDVFFDFSVTHSLMTPSITTVPSLRTPLTRTGRSGLPEVHCSGSVSAMQVMSVVAFAV